MSLFDFFRSKRDSSSPAGSEVTRNEFARLMMDALQEAGAEGLSYDADHFSLKIAQHNGIFLLNNAYDEYRVATPDQRPQLIRHYALSQSRPSPKVSEDWEEAAPCLLPLLRSRTLFENLTTPEKAEDRVVWEPLGTSLGLALGYDLPTTVTYVQNKFLTLWGVSYEQALSRACENLLTKSTEPFIEISPGLFKSPWADAHDPARMVIPEVISRLKLAGRPVAGVPHRNLLLVAGSEDATALTALAAAMEKERDQPRANTCCVYMLEASGWKPFVPPPQHPAYAGLLRLQLITEARDYAEQANRLEAEHKKSGRDIFVAKISVVTERNTNLTWSYAVWVRDLPTLLPRTDYIALVDPLLPEKQQMLGRVPWDEVAARCPELGQPTPGYPPRFYLQGFPTAEALAELRPQAPN